MLMGFLGDWLINKFNERTYLHLYGKSEARPGRKMGHLTVVGNRAAEVLAATHQLRDDITPSP